LFVLTAQYTSMIFMIIYRLYTSVPVFLIGSSFIHYGIYIATYYHRPRDVAFLAFKNTVMTFKATALLQMAYIYCKNFSYDPVSLALIVAGFALSTAAATALGIDRTYFGYELQVVPPSKPVTTFPYNCGVPHPMIVGNLLWLSGLYKMQGFRDAIPWLAPVHMALYTVHMLQEHFDIKKANTSNKQPAVVVGSTASNSKQQQQQQQQQQSKKGAGSRGDTPVAASS
jgi:Phospholipid methyltransferase